MGWGNEAMPGVIKEASVYYHPLSWGQDGSYAFCEENIYCCGKIKCIWYLHAKFIYLFNQKKLSSSLYHILLFQFLLSNVFSMFFRVRPLNFSFLTTDYNSLELCRWVFLIKLHPHFHRWPVFTLLPLTIGQVLIAVRTEGHCTLLVISHNFLVPILNVPQSIYIEYIYNVIWVSIIYTEYIWRV